MSEKTVQDRLADIYTWLREPDFIEEASLAWLMDWMNRRPIAEVAMVAMLTDRYDEAMAAIDECLPPSPQEVASVPHE